MEIAARASLDLYHRMEALEAANAQTAPRLDILEGKADLASGVLSRVGALEATAVELGQKADTVSPPNSLHPPHQPLNHYLFQAMEIAATSSLDLFARVEGLEDDLEQLTYASRTVEGSANDLVVAMDEQQKRMFMLSEATDEFRQQVITSFSYPIRSQLIYW